MDAVLANVTVELCGRLAEALKPLIVVPIPDVGCTVAHLRAQIAQHHPALADDMASPRVRACVDDAIIDDAMLIHAAQRIAFFPPVSGG